MHARFFVCSAYFLAKKDLKRLIAELEISEPDWNCPSALLTIFAIILHKFNVIEEAFRFSSNTSDALKRAVVSQPVNKRTPETSHPTPDSVLFTVGKIRKLASMLDTSQYPPLPQNLNHLSYEEFILSQTPKAVEKLDQTLSKGLVVVKNYFIWKEKEDYFWTWITQSVNYENFSKKTNSASPRIHDDAKFQYARTEKLLGAFQKVPAPKFKPDRLKATTQLSLAMSLQLSKNSNQLPTSSKKLHDEIQQLEEDALKILNQKLKKLPKDIIPVF